MDFNLTIPIIFKRKECQNCFSRKKNFKSKSANFLILLFIQFKHFISVSH